MSTVGLWRRQTLASVWRAVAVSTIGDELLERGDRRRDGEAFDALMANAVPSAGPPARCGRVWSVVCQSQSDG
jgi:hypothetical protein